MILSSFLSLRDPPQDATLTKIFGNSKKNQHSIEILWNFEILHTWNGALIHCFFDHFFQLSAWRFCSFLLNCCWVSKGYQQNQIISSKNFRKIFVCVFDGFSNFKGFFGIIKQQSFKCKTGCLWSLGDSIRFFWEKKLNIGGLACCLPSRTSSWELGGGLQLCTNGSRDTGFPISEHVFNAKLHSFFWKCQVH